MARSYFDLVPTLLAGPMYIDISRDEIERILLQDKSFDRSYEDTETGVPFRVCIQLRKPIIESISFAILVHETRIAGIDFEVKFDDMDGVRNHGWHKHVWDVVDQDSDGNKVPVSCFDGVADLREWLIRACKELNVQMSGRDYGEPSLQFD